MTLTIRSYSELQKLKSFDERFDYLRLKGNVGESTFGYDRYLNQILYRSIIWRRARDEVIIRDEACDLGVSGYDIFDKIIIHHMNPITMSDIKEGKEAICDPEFLICVSHKTHLAIHFGNEELLPKLYIRRRPGDTIPWR